MGDAVRRVFAPGRVNLIGDHVDYVGGLVLPMAVDLGTTIEIVPGSGQAKSMATFVSDAEREPAVIGLPVADPNAIRPDWARYPAAVLAEMGCEVGFDARISTTLPVGAGLSSSASLAVAVALAAGHDGDRLHLARLCRRAERRATGVPCGIMDQLVITSATEGSALLIDCRDESVESVPLPEGTAVQAVHCGVSRRLEGSAYGQRRRACELAETMIGPLREAGPGDLRGIDDNVVRRRARHVVTEIARVRLAVGASRSDDASAFGALMNESHASLRDDFAVSTPELDRLVARLQSTPGVHGARLTGAGFGGCVVALVDERVDPAVIGGWRLSPAAAAHVIAE